MAPKSYARAELQDSARQESGHVECRRRHGRGHVQPPDQARSNLPAVLELLRQVLREPALAPRGMGAAKAGNAGQSGRAVDRSANAWPSSACGGRCSPTRRTTSATFRRRKRRSIMTTALTVGRHEEAVRDFFGSQAASWPWLATSIPTRSSRCWPRSSTVGPPSSRTSGSKK